MISKAPQSHVLRNRRTTRLGAVLSGNADRVHKDRAFISSIRKVTAGAPPHGPVALAVEKWFSTWGILNLIGSVSIRKNARLRSSIARLVVTDRRVELGPLFFSAPVDHREVLCHELAHFAAHVKYGRRIRPHGPEWCDLVRAAGFQPRVRHPEVGIRVCAQEHHSRTHRYEHRCPVCHSVWCARKRMTTWRCASCTAAGLPGKLRIRMLQVRSQSPLR